VRSHTTRTRVLAKSALLSAAILGALSIVASLPQFYVSQTASIASTRDGVYPTSRGGNFIVINYRYRFNGVDCHGVGSHLVRKHFGGAPYGHEGDEYVKRWLREHPAGSQVDIKVFRWMPSWSGYDMSSADWLSKFLLYSLLAWVVLCAALGAVAFGLTRRVGRAT
jgi:hypothetical protein